MVDNSGNGYDRNDGIFTAPLNGTYVFTWVISTNNGDWQSSELVKEGAIYGYSLADSVRASTGDQDYNTASNTVVIKVGAVHYNFKQITCNVIDTFIFVFNSRFCCSISDDLSCSPLV